MTRMPVYFVSHGGGPWPFVDGMRGLYVKTEAEFRALSKRLPTKPTAIVAISGHWEESEFTVSTAANPSMVYDYYGFPENTYRVKYPAPGSPSVAARVKALLSDHGLAVRESGHRGFDHGTFVPLSLMFPNADVPVVSLSMKRTYNVAEHIRMGQALAPLRNEGVLIIGSGLTYHNMSGFGRAESTRIAEGFQGYLNNAVEQTDSAVREHALLNWESAPGARLVHPQEDHLIPLMVVAGAAGESIGKTMFTEYVMKVPMTSYEFGAL
ncbi:DODA-type extradiol aromatic ring-opening family dioxygenase [Sapientia aquatica]|uniref:Dioxygenase n=1 Tax=Sapientia aquatica TaxID=1549640 RepID=A0A4R5VZB0_9BURK|nr:class III extradiol ring-cleavage dioxygenase [Sapientia aquatica]TDK64501.1 dioxygenase [Sapientia aquatica]